MKRKIVRHGPSSLTVSLPMKWAKRNNLNAGDEIEVLEEEKELRIGADVREEFQKTEIILDSVNEWYIGQIIRNLYLAGYDEVDVDFEDKETITKIQKVVHLLMGFEIIEQKEYSCVIKNLSTGIETELDNLLRKIFLLNKSLFEVTIEQLETNKPNYQMIKDMRDNIHRFGHLFRRTITKKRLYGVLQNAAIFMVMTRLLMISNNIMYAQGYLRKKSGDLKTAAAYLKKVLKLFNLFYEIFYSKKYERLVELNRLRDELINREFISIAETKKVESIVLCHYYAEIVRLIATSGGLIIRYHSE